MNEGESNLGLSGLETLGQKGDKIKMIKIESPIGNTLPQKLTGAYLHNEPETVTVKRITLAESIKIGKNVRKESRKKDKNDGVMMREFFVTKSVVKEIEKVTNPQNGKVHYFVSSQNARYRVYFLKK